MWLAGYSAIVHTGVYRAGLSLRVDLGEKDSLNWLSSSYIELREKLKCIEHIGK